MRTNATTILILGLCFYLLGCSDQGISPSATGDKTNDVAIGDAFVQPLSFATNKWWSFYPNVQGTKYNACYGSNGTSWPYEVNTFGFHPQWIKTVYLNGLIYLFYYHNNNFRLRTSNNGINWSIEQVISGLTTSSSNGRINYPELALINGELYAYVLHMNGVNNLALSIKRFQGYGFIYVDWILQFAYSSGDFTSPSVAKVNGIYYLFYSQNQNQIMKVQSTDGINWSSLGSVCLGNCSIGGNAIDAVTFNNNIYISYKQPDNSLGYIRYDGTGGYVFVISSSAGIHKTSGINTPIATDGSKLIISYTGNTSDYNFISYSYNGSTWTQAQIKGRSSNSYREILYTGL